MFFFGQKYLAKESEEKWPNNHINKLTKTALCNLKKRLENPYLKLTEKLDVKEG